MEMISKMPESCYELSLKDLVEVKTEEEDDRKVFDEMPQRRKNQSKAVRKVGSDKWVDPVRVNSGGFLLKLGFPVSLGAKKRTKKKKKKGEDDDDASVTGSVSEDKDWLKSESGRGVSRINSGSSKSSGGSSIRSNSDRSRGSLR
ncbi:hypothetical protein DY000_02064136 [Brassica cretica]|uniref:Uncharacterized protein n=1 Tax=Brassica cretica TaxID=69181 RepID=A0ABQ7AQR0_BRACR|nr:hypothetical protein DY000_02064136 [Brassica cretica]